jgi:ActR/RegA family two-component response regulator
MNPASSSFVGKVLLVSNDAIAITQLTDSLQRFALFAEQRSDVASALERLNRAKFEAVIVDLQLGSQAEAVLEGIRNSPSN